MYDIFNNVVVWCGITFLVPNFYSYCRGELRTLKKQYQRQRMSLGLAMTLILMGSVLMVCGLVLGPLSERFYSTMVAVVTFQAIAPVVMLSAVNDSRDHFDVRYVLWFFGGGIAKVDGKGWYF